MRSSPISNAPATNTPKASPTPSPIAQNFNRLGKSGFKGRLGGSRMRKRSPCCRSSGCSSHQRTQTKGGRMASSRHARGISRCSVSGAQTAGTGRFRDRGSHTAGIGTALGRIAHRCRGLASTARWARRVRAVEIDRSRNGPLTRYLSSPAPPGA